MKPNKRSSQTGFSLIEVLVSVLIMAFCMLSVAGMLMFAHKSNASSYIKQQATQSAYDIIDAMRANRTAAYAGNYAVSNLGGAAPAAPGTDCTAVTCTAQQTANWDLFVWQTRLATYGGSAAITFAPANGTASAAGTVATVIVQWDDSQAQSTLGRSTATGNGVAANLEQVILHSQL